MHLADPESDLATFFWLPLEQIRCDAVGGPNGTESALAEQPCSLCTTQNVPCHFEVRSQPLPIDLT